MLEYVFRTADILVQSVYISSLVHMYKDYLYMFIVHMYTMYYLSVVLVLCKDVIRLCSYRVKGEGSYKT